jgi:mono/diheme cytochrome c family protein
MSRWSTSVRYPGLAVVLALALLGSSRAQQQPGAPTLKAATEREALGEFIDRHCSECHNSDDKAAELDLEALGTDPDGQPKVWEKVVRKLASRQMPPAKRTRPTEQEYDAVLSSITGILDRSADAHPNPGRTDTFRRLNRTEYQNAIRDLLALEIDASTLLPADESSHGFDNVTVGDLSPTLLDRYITAAQKISRLAIGSAGRSPGGDTFRVRPDITQEEHVEGLPIGTRGGALIRYTFPRDGEYDVQLRLARDRNEHLEGLREPHELEVLLDRERKALLTVTPPKSEREHETADQHLKSRIHAKAGPHEIGVTFLKKPSTLLETKRQPYQAHYNMHRHPRLTPALYEVSITGPYSSEGHGVAPSRQRVFVCEPNESGDEDACARRIISTLMRRAYRRPVVDADFEKPLALFREARADGSFDSGIEMALSAILVNPNFLFRIETEPAGVAPKSAYRIPDVQLASRLSFFLWSSIPDDELLDLAERGELSKPGVLETQARRMLADPRSENLVSNFADQWLHLRNLDSITPDLRLFPDFDDNLRQAFRRETELLFEEVLHEDRSVLDLIVSDHTYLNERLAKHYGIPHVQGSRFRRIDLAGDKARGGLLRQGSVLTVTSYATRTSPVIRGKWILANILGTPPPPPPANVPALKDNTVSASLSVRERLAEHRRNVACAGCHKLMDPVGFSLENYDAVGRWRTTEEGRPVDATGGLPDGSQFEGVAGLEAALLKRPDLFVGTMAEKLLTFGLGRGVEAQDAPSIRKIVRDARAKDYRVSSVIVGIVTSNPFTMRNAE